MVVLVLVSIFGQVDEVIRQRRAGESLKP